MFTPEQGKVVEAMTVWADANQRVLRELAELSAATAKEGVRLYAELQQSAIETDARRAGRRDGAGRARWQDGAKDPFVLVPEGAGRRRRGHPEGRSAHGGQCAGVTRTAERVQASAEQAGQGDPGDALGRSVDEDEGRLRRGPALAYFARPCASRAAPRVSAAASRNADTSSRSCSASRLAAVALALGRRAPLARPPPRARRPVAEDPLGVALAGHDALEARLHRLLHEVLPGLAVLDELVQERRWAALARWLRSFSRMIWARVTEVRSSPEAASTTEISGRRGSSPRSPRA